MPTTYLVPFLGRPMTMQSEALRLSRLLGHLQARCISAGSISIPRYLSSHTRKFIRPAFSSTSTQRIRQVRTVTTIPIQQGNARVQHVKLLAPKGRFFQNKWIQRIFIWIVFLRLMGWFWAGEKPKDIADVTDASQINILPAQEDKAGAGEEPVPQDEEEEVTITIDEENAWFLPLTWPRRKPPVPYKATDEEWLEFCSFAKDGEKHRVVQGQAVEFTHFVANHHPHLKKVLGKISPQSRYWLDIDYPLKYDEGYEMTGIVITDDFIALASRDYDESTVQHFQRVISTAPMLSALWNITKTMFTGEEALMTAIKKNDKLPLAIPGVPDLDSTPELAKVLRSSIKKLRARPPALKSVPRGCVRVSGRIDIHGSKAWAEFFILGYYNPKQNAWTALPAIGLGPVRPVSIRAPG